MTIPRWRAPREDGAALVVPSWKDLPDLITENQRLVQQSALRFGDRTLAEARQLAHDNADQEINSGAKQLGWQGAPLHRPLIVTGHQPELFHPGVWAKNVAISKLARQLGGSSFNINVDSDVAKSTTLKLPTVSSEHYDQIVSFSPVKPPLPYEEWQCNDEQAFADVPTQIAPVLSQWPWKPVLPDFWKAAVQAGKQTRNLPERWTIARRQWEQSHGIVNHELTMSRWCRTDFFAWLLKQFITDHAKFAAIYNDELQKYRQEHRIRSANHPVADLLVTGGLTELPFWAWSAGTTQRGRLCARKAQGDIQLIALINGQEAPLPLTEDSGLRTQDWGDWKIRPKALITSMMFRLFLADLFVHGIGGAVYDELTDRIFARFWNISLPRFAVVTATLRLPWDQEPLSQDEPLKIRQTLRSLEWNPDRFVTATMDKNAHMLSRNKHRLLLQATPPEKLADRHRQLETIRSQLQSFVAGIAAENEIKLTKTLLQLKQDDHLFSREHPWVLYPEEKLNELITQMQGW